MNTFSNNSRTSMDTNLETPQKKDSNSIKLKKKRKNLKNKKLHSKDFATFANKSSLTRSKKFKFPKDLTNHHVLWLLPNTDGQPTWKES